ncbi:MAG: molybdopterin-guanine dinucleotide biosynthesis protein B [Candidatus Bathyarchaeia archaeon]|nr:molybdopterin-guanine dinucleotide biosynthesis protein B [Candidatus Bathyarchaeia archaeon]
MKKPLVIAVVGSKSSGKTTTIEILTRELTKRGYKIAAIKHIPEPNFTIDKAGKDTWRFAQSGAKTIISAASNEIATIEKVNTENFSLKEILKKCEGHDIIFVEGFRKLVGKDKSIYKIAVVKSAEESSEAIRNFEPILAFTGPYSTEATHPKIPFVDLMKNPEKIADIVEKAFKGFLP